MWIHPEHIDLPECFARRTGRYEPLSPNTAKTVDLKLSATAPHAGGLTKKKRMLLRKQAVAIAHSDAHLPNATNVATWKTFDFDGV